MQPSGGSGGAVLPFPARNADQVGFTREELTRILDLYGRMVAAGEWRDYAMDFTLTGRLAALGNSVVKRKAEETRREFSKRIAAELGSE